MSNKSIYIQRVKRMKHTILSDYDRVQKKEQGIEVKNIKKALKSILPELKREKISRSESCI